MFEPWPKGSSSGSLRLEHARGLAFGFGGLRAAGEALLPGRDVLAEHLRRGSGAVILSRTFHSSQGSASFEDESRRLRATEAALALRTGRNRRRPTLGRASRKRSAGSRRAMTQGSMNA
jgi:hypothetical protein